MGFLPEPNAALDCNALTCSQNRRLFRPPAAKWRARYQENKGLKPKVSFRLIIQGGFCFRLDNSDGHRNLPGAKASAATFPSNDTKNRKQYLRNAKISAQIENNPPQENPNRLQLGQNYIQIGVTPTVATISPRGFPRRTDSFCQNSFHYRRALRWMTTD